MISLREESDPAGAAPSPGRVVEDTAAVFAAGGALQRELGLDHRPEQEIMAGAVAAACRDDSPLLFEAGTGVGKSLAYLIPGILHAVDQSRQLIVSTHTISLQEQIEHQDLPICRRLFEARPEWRRQAAFRSSVLVGKANYLCPTRLAHALAEHGSLFADAEFDELQRLAAWAASTETGLRHELRPAPRPEVWEAVNADSAACSRKHCDCERCFYQRARARLRSSQVIILNHALLFTLIRTGGARAQGGSTDGRGILFPNDFLVLDEAHKVAEVATENFGLALSSIGFDRALRHLYNPRTRKGLLVRHGGSEGPQAVSDTLEAARQFFDFLGSTLLAAQPVVRVREPDVAEPLLDVPLERLHRLVARLADRMPDGRERDEFIEQRQRLRGLQAGVAEWLALGERDHVYWAERGGRKQQIVTLRSAPIDIAPELRRCLFGNGTAVVCTSATLAIGGRMDPFATRIGAEEARAVAVRSPFDFETQMQVYVAADIPSPDGRNPRLAHEALADYIGFCASRVPGGSLVLFTSYTDLRAVAALLENHFREEGRPFLQQGADLSRSELTRRMRQAGNAILFGTDSFWTGVDVPGAALAQVIITRLPFDPPTHPVTEARMDWIRDRGGNPFQELTLPEALIKFRQGVGRLIRSRTDRGTITILDSRALTRTYGPLFLECLPQPHFARLSRELRIDTFRPFS